ncbi:LPS assembly lipoprotein LptE [Carnimonas bestiolae]|uniref:LPS-assembly lipoprotein LptE n=1 Tax=Carnimonas bestiolae TaxID=3402172 RepID=UPI003EDBFEF3
MTRATQHRRSPLLATLLAGSLCALTLSGCGFQLRGIDNESRPIVQHLQLNIQGDTPQNAVARELRQRLETAGVSVDSSASLELNVGAPEYDESQVGYGGSGGNQERNISLRVPFSVQRTTDGAYVIDGQVVQVNGTYNTSTSQLLQRDQERDQLQRRLSREAASQLVERLRAASASSNADILSPGTPSSSASSTSEAQ